MLLPWTGPTRRVYSLRLGCAPCRRPVEAPPRPVTERSALELAAAIRSRELSCARGRRRAHRADRGAQPRRQRDRRDPVRRGARRGRRRRRAPRARAAGARTRRRCSACRARSRSRSRSPGCRTPPARSPAATSSPSARRPRSSGCVDAGRDPARGHQHVRAHAVDRVREPRLGADQQRLRPGRTAGGSSGGEGASIGSGFAPIGLGTDIGGSIRLPAFFNGVFGHKPTGALVPHTGHYPFPNERGSSLLGCGPLARRAEDLMPFLRVDRRSRRRSTGRCARSSSATRRTSRSRACGW